MAIGILLMTVSGLCSLAVIVNMIRAVVTDHGSLAGLLVPLIFGGLPFALGWGAFTVGRRWTRKGRYDDVFE